VTDHDVFYNDPGRRGPSTVNDYQFSSSRERTESLGMLLLDTFSLLPEAAGTGLTEGETGQAEPEWPVLIY